MYGHVRTCSGHRTDMHRHRRCDSWRQVTQTSGGASSSSPRGMWASLLVLVEAGAARLALGGDAEWCLLVTWSHRHRTDMYGHVKDMHGHVKDIPFCPEKKEPRDLHHKSFKTDSCMTKYSCSDHHRGIKHQPHGPVNPLQLSNRPQPRYIPLFQRQKLGGAPPGLGGPNQHKCCNFSP